MNVVVIGGGAAGFFAAISVKLHHPLASVTILEKSTKSLVKVKVSGGGRCNVTHNAHDRKYLLSNYPRGSSFLKQVFNQFAVQHTIDWFESKGVGLITEADGRMFPKSNDSQTIIDLFHREIERLGIKIRYQFEVIRLVQTTKREWLVEGKSEHVTCNNVIITSGGKPNPSGYQWLIDLGQPIVPPVPSLFTFNLTDSSITSLAGVSAGLVKVRIQRTEFAAVGPLLITHWGLSGPAVLKCSAFGARFIAESNYRFPVQINWLGNLDEESWRNTSEFTAALNSTKQVSNLNPTQLPSRLWQFLVERAEISLHKRWLDLSKKEKNRLVNTLTNDVWQVEGKTTFKEEFVTAGGVDLKFVDPTTLRSTLFPGVYFAGEVLDIDGVTGGFNFQAAWSTSFVAGQLQ